jgi:hypothetical protein
MKVISKSIMSFVGGRGYVVKSSRQKYETPLFRFVYDQGFGLDLFSLIATRVPTTMEFGPACGAARRAQSIAICGSSFFCAFCAFLRLFHVWKGALILHGRFNVDLENLGCVERPVRVAEHLTS